ncbi:MAG: response regulator [bacterium]|nr:response regulator [bacterium]
MTRSDSNRPEKAAQRSEDQLIQSQKMEAIGRLAGGLAHDFNNLLTAITGYSDLILKRVTDERLRTYVGEIKKAGDRAADLTSKLLTLSRQRPSSQKVVDLNRLVNNLESLLRRLIGEDVELVTKLDPALWRVRVDPGQLEQILLNLVVNARDAMPTGGRLLVESFNVEWGEEDRPLDLEADRCACLAVSDTGVGIEPEVREHIFEPFFTTKEEGKGTGLGLSTVYAAAAQNHGHVAVESTPGEGSTFLVYLPSVAAEADADPVASSEAAPDRGHERILLVEDDAGVRRLVGEVLEQEGYQVVAAENAAAALELVASLPEDVEFLVTDVVMPGMSGPELAERLRQGIPDLPVLFISGYTDSLVVRHGLADAEHVMLQKPFDGRLLASRVREILDR